MFIFGNIQNSYILNKLRKTRGLVPQAKHWDCFFFQDQNMHHDILNKCFELFPIYISDLQNKSYSLVCITL